MLYDDRGATRGGSRRTLRRRAADTRRRPPPAPADWQRPSVRRRGLIPIACQLGVALSASGPQLRRADGFAPPEGKRSTRRFGARPMVQWTARRTRGRRDLGPTRTEAFQDPAPRPMGLTCHLATETAVGSRRRIEVRLAGRRKYVRDVARRHSLRGQDVLPRS